MTTIRLGKDQIEEAAVILKQGEPVAIPTETVYGLAAPIFHREAVKKIFTLKKRPADNPLIAHISSMAMLAMIAENVPDSFFRLTDCFWPGPLALILPKKERVSLLVSGGHGTIAVRMPSHPTALTLLEAVGEPLVAPSANISGRPSPTTVQDVLEDLNGSLKAVLDGGPCELGIESTVLSLVHDIPTLLRPGSISKEQIEDVLQRKIAAPQQEERALSPGMKYRHYAPKAKIQIVDQLPEEAR
ncbi:MAG TPA: L-threonylcarbamoyladenylate synthase, partial [Chlamydiales bacterium]|nr:L-threonylcarbamoyladenylate synthase [Chlamydiales bacterium]